MYSDKILFFIFLHEASKVNTNEETCLKKDDPKIVATAKDDLCDVKPILSEPIHTTSLVGGKNLGECDAATNQGELC